MSCVGIGHRELDAGDSTDPGGRIDGGALARLHTSSVATPVIRRPCSSGCLDAAKVIELHGTIHETECLRCGVRGPMRDTLDRVEAGEDDPACRRCGGILKSATISFGQRMNTATLTAAAEAAMSCRTFAAVGTSLTVHPAAGLVDVAAMHGARIVLAMITE
ncbi:Sir2 family NAD-dependent protein deacetylase [Dactylosporangium sp. NPDC000555]|uniref:Sir2 family NAD-dependent protein deacetylase n=1 Tax=Dactylosporangium sp. NPDC000555 TaxID=3154260 RepID=UPI003326860B